MALFFNDQILSDSNKKSVIRCMGVFDGSGQETANVKIIGSTLRGALAVDSNNAVTVAMGGAAKTNYRYGISRIAGCISGTGYLRLDFSGSTIGPIMTLSGSFDYNMQDNLGVIQNTAIAPTGNILFSTTGFSAQSAYSIVLELHKVVPAANGVPAGTDYDQGQIAKPSDFNFGAFGIKP